MATPFQYMSPQEQAYIQSLQDYFNRQAQQADARAMGEAQRRGLVNPTGTSSLEFNIRKAATDPIQRAGAEAVTGAAAQSYGRERDAQLQGILQGYFDPNQNKWTKENIGGRDYWGGQLGQTRQNIHEQGMALMTKPKKSKWWEPIVGGIAGGIGTGVGLYGASKIPGLGG